MTVSMSALQRGLVGTDRGLPPSRAQAHVHRIHGPRHKGKQLLAAWMDVRGNLAGSTVCSLRWHKLCLTTTGAIELERSMHRGRAAAPFWLRSLRFTA